MRKNPISLLLFVKKTYQWVLSAAGKISIIRF